jgi:hypothetical protein
VELLVDAALGANIAGNQPAAADPAATAFQPSSSASGRASRMNSPGLTPMLADEKVFVCTQL